MRGRPPSAALRDLAAVLAAARAGERYRDIAARYAVCTSTINKITQRHGLLRPRGRPAKQGSAEIYSLRSTGFPAAQLRDTLGLPT